MTTITAELHQGYAVSLSTSDGHQWRADEPEDAGGTGTGPDPYALLVGALAACTCMTISMYCRRKEWPLERVDARFTHEKVHVDDCAECESEDRGRIDRIQGEITVGGTFDDAQRRRLREVAARCPVRKTLDKGVVVTDEVTFA